MVCWSSGLQENVCREVVFEKVSPSQGLWQRLPLNRLDELSRDVL